MKNPMWLRYNNKNDEQKRPIISFFSDDFGLRSPVIQKKNGEKKCKLCPSMRPKS